MLEKFHQFCAGHNHNFPPTEQSVLANFLSELASTSARPSSILRTATAAIGHVYKVKGMTNIIDSFEIRMLLSALVKSGTFAPMSRSKVMPVHKFNNLFLSWGDNQLLDLKSLRLKAITLLALTAMLRPSDIAPNARVVTPSGEDKVVFSVNQIEFQEGYAKIIFFGIKNDMRRSGFEVMLPRASSPQLDPVRALEDYIQRTETYRGGGGPVFITLRPPYKALEASSVAKILDEAIELAGLGNQGYTAKSFRPTGATSAVEQGIKPETVRKVGRWKDAEVFYSHYVHANTPESFTDDIINHD